MKVLITGASGFVGRTLSKALFERGYELVILTRNKERTEASFPYPAQVWEWQDPTTPPPIECFLGVEAVFHLMGESIADGRWTEEKKRKLIQSRVDATEQLVQAILKLDLCTIQSFISTSGVGVYPNSLDIESNEASPLGEGFLAQLCKDWEGALKPLPTKIRKVVLRLGLVLGEGGILAKLLPAFRLGATSPLGSGKQWMSWIQLQDLINLYLWALDNPKAQGPYNAVAMSTQNSEFHRVLAKSLSRPLLPKIPAIVLTCLFGDMAKEALLASQKVRSTKLEEEGFTFAAKDLNQALKQSGI